MKAPRPARAPHPNDLIVGQNIRLHRIAAKMAQAELGQKLGVTFQQIQKYEKGANRVGAGRLQVIAEVLDVPVTVFFAGGKRTRGHSPLELLSETDAFNLAEAFSKIENPAIRRALVALVQNISST
jgi:transcriptional regulator with XRE-family HTH domain